MCNLIKISVSFLTLIIGGSNLFAQVKQIDIPIYLNSDTSLFFQWANDRRILLGLENLTNCKDSLHFRYWSENQVLDISTNDYQKFSGLLYNFTESTSDSMSKLRKLSERFFSSIIKFENDTTRLIYNHFNQAKIFEIPSCEKISGWQKVLDGSAYFIEYSTPYIYRFNVYSNPSYSNNLPEGHAINLMVQFLNIELKLESSWNRFLHFLPDGCYKVNMGVVTCKRKKRS